MVSRLIHAMRRTGHVGDPPQLRARRVEVAVVACTVSVAWAAFAGLTSLAVGAVAGSLSLLAFGLSSVIDGSASAVLVWLFRAGRDRVGRSPDRHRYERVATRAVAGAMLAAAAYVLAQAAELLATGAHLAHSRPSLVLLAGSLVVLPPLGVVKLRLGRLLDHQALRGDGILSLVGGALALAALAGLAADERFGWWWTDPAAAMLIALVLLREGARTLRLWEPERARNADRAARARSEIELSGSSD
ncbi:cation transporter [Streptacidiphilus melanogenes]|uniref:cation transporter n=1 Tax=Streptacidiphilus melanogenes TaxID=411235 RepID=UPI0006934D2E|nr:cation transporter [Streptacidiphilus melanogenes]